MIKNYDINDIEILYQDKYFLIVNKPSGMLSVKGNKPENGKSLIELLVEKYPSATIVHRLDMDTSGVMVVPLNKMAHRSISKQFQDRQTIKRYEAVVMGNVVQDCGEINEPLIVDWDNLPKQKIDYENGKPSTTFFEVIKRTDKFTKLSLKPITGRSHQLRVHLLSIGFPIISDSLYSEGEVFAAAERLQLHSCSLRFTHPVTKQPVEYTADAKLII
jgi:tRNA pseudouridine32 synthase / 23S rRNA pseudouridine746 synthase